MLHMMVAFSHVVRSGSFSAAAERLDTSTGQVSRRVAALESHLHVKLLNRTTRRLALTEVGQRYLVRCEQIIACIQEAEGEISSGRSMRAAPIRIRVTTDVDSQCVVGAIARFRKQHPQVHFNLTISDKQVEPDDTEHDVSIMLADELPQGAPLATCLGKTRLVACASPLYLKRKGVPVQPGDLARFDWVRMASDTQGRIAFMCDEAPAHWLPSTKTAVTVNSLSALANVLANHLGVGLLPLSVARKAFAERQLVEVLPGYHSRVMGIYAMGNIQSRFDSRIAQWLEYLQTALSHCFVVAPPSAR